MLLVSFKNVLVSASTLSWSIVSSLLWSIVSFTDTLLYQRRKLNPYHIINLGDRWWVERSFYVMQYLRRHVLKSILYISVLSCTIVLQDQKIVLFRNWVPKTAASQKGLETCSRLSTCCQIPYL